MPIEKARCIFRFMGKKEGIIDEVRKLSVYEKLTGQVASATSSKQIGGQKGGTTEAVKSAWRKAQGTVLILIDPKEVKFMGKKLYIGNLSFDMTDEGLGKAFSEFGEIISAVVVKESISGRSKGFGFVEFAKEESARKAKESMDGKELDGRALRVDEAREQRERRRFQDRDYRRRF
jgi:RNA recognition motif-containing protein